MKVVIDTSSLLSLVRYYLPFDSDYVLHDFFKSRVESGEIIILDKVFDECKFIAKGIILKALKYIGNKKYRVKTDDILPTKKFFNQLENQFVNGAIRNKLTNVEFENRKNNFLDSADAKILLFCLRNRGLLDDELFIVTEETEISNDNKSFKKLPAICKILELKVMTLPELIKLYKDIDLIIS